MLLQVVAELAEALQEQPSPYGGRSHASDAGVGAAHLHVGERAPPENHRPPGS